MYLRSITEYEPPIMSMDDSPLPLFPFSSPHESWMKQVIFIRHGESIANTYDDSHPAKTTGDELIDAKLTSLGISQASSLQSFVDDWMTYQWTPQIIITSPLSRALQTTCHAFQNLNTAFPGVPIIAWPLVTEFYSWYRECQGRPRSALQNDPILLAHPSFSSISFDDIDDDNWWRVSDDQSRPKAFLSWLRLSPFRRIVVVAHWGFIYNLLVRDVHCGKYLHISNCASIYTSWSMISNETQLAIDLPSCQRKLSVWLVPSLQQSQEYARNPLLKELRTFWFLASGQRKIKETLSDYQQKTLEWLRQSSTIQQEGGGMPHISLTEYIPIPSINYMIVIQDLIQTIHSACYTMRKFHTKLQVNAKLPSVNHQQSSIIDYQRYPMLFIRIFIQFSSLISILCQELSQISIFEGAVRDPNNLWLPILRHTETSFSPTLQDIASITIDTKPGAFIILKKLFQYIEKFDTSSSPPSKLLECLNAIQWSVVIVSKNSMGDADWRIEPGTLITI